jgi:hypothetical protein
MCLLWHIYYLCKRSNAEELWHQCLHADEHDEQPTHAFRLRNRYHRRGLDVRPAIGIQLPRRAGGLEQQLRR